MYTLKYQYNLNQKVLIATDSAAGTKKIAIPIPADYMEIIEFGIIPVTDGGDANYAVGLKKGQTTIVEQVHNTRHTMAASVAPKDRLMPINFTVQKGEQFNVLVDLNEVLTSDLTFYLCLTLFDRASFEANSAVEHPHTGEDGAEVIVNSTDTPAPFSYK